MDAQHRLHLSAVTAGHMRERRNTDNIELYIKPNYKLLVENIDLSHHHLSSTNKLTTNDFYDLSQPFYAKSPPITDLIYRLPFLFLKKCAPKLLFYSSLPLCLLQSQLLILRIESIRPFRLSTHRKAFMRTVNLVRNNAVCPLYSSRSCLPWLSWWLDHRSNE